jgi:flagellar basal body-associated protein FliL
VSQIKYIKLTDEQVRARSRRSIAIALGLLVFIALVFFVTVSRMHANNQARQAGERAALATLERADPNLPAPVQPDAEPGAPLTTEAVQP